ncbi:MAG TPA: hypothetical protein DHV77_01410, partial [Erysipelotrichaceae bacterium]|nr:hypothetical protein [Erysipelotrichaceae bacterium]
MIGNVVSGRSVPLKGIENSVGMFINTIPLRIHSISSDESIFQMLKRMQEDGAACSSYEHAGLGTLKISNRNVSEYIKHLFVFENYPGVGESVKTEQNELGLEALYGREQTNYDLSFAACLLNGRLLFKLQYDPRRFTERSIRIIADHLERIVYQLHNSDMKVNDIEMISKKEQEIILGTFNNTIVSYQKNRTIVQLFEEQVKKNAKSNAVVYEGQN